MKSDLSNFAVPLNYTYPEQLQLIYDIAPGVSIGICPVFRSAHEEWDGFGNVFSRVLVVTQNPALDRYHRLEETVQQIRKTSVKLIGEQVLDWIMKLDNFSAMLYCES